MKYIEHSYIVKNIFGRILFSLQIKLHIYRCKQLHNFGELKLIKYKYIAINK